MRKERCLEFLSKILSFTLMKLNLIPKTLPVEIILTLKLTKIQNVMKEPCFQFSLINFDFYFNETKPDTENTSN